MNSRILYGLLAAVLLAGASACCLTCDAGTRHLNGRNQVGIVAHRGYWNCEEAGYAKNSIAALRCAQENRFWGSEFDVNMTADGVLLVYHDSHIGDKLIEDYPYSEFKDVRIANGEPIPTLDQYLEQGKKSPRTMLVYEMKPHSSPEAEDRFIELTILKLKEYRLLNPRRVMFISFSHHICMRMAELLPDFTVQYLEGDKTPAELKAEGIHGLDYSYKVLYEHPEWAEEARELDMTTNSWTVNTDEDITRIISQRIMYITTDYPLETRRLLKENKRREVR